MRANTLAILTLVIITAVITFFITKHFYNAPDINNKTISSKSRNGLGTNMLPVASHAYALAAAHQDIIGFQTIINTAKAGDSAGTNTVVAYTIGLQDIITAFGLNLPQGWTSSYSAIRVYPGFNKSVGFKLFIVSVNESDTLQCGTCGNGISGSGQPLGGRDMFFDTSGQSIIPNPTVGQGNFVLDLIAPCPTTCDTSSRLVQGLSCVCCTCSPQQALSTLKK